MELYYSPLACSMAARVVAAEAEVPLVVHQVELFDKLFTESGGDYLAIAPLGMVPALRLPDGSLLTEVAAVLQYLADRKPERGLAPPPGSLARYRMIEQLSFIGAELHKRTLWVLYNPDTPEAAKAFARAGAAPVFDHLERQLQGRPYLGGEHFTCADAYLGWALQLAHVAQLDLRGGRPSLTDYVARVRERPSVRSIYEQELPLAMAARERKARRAEQAAQAAQAVQAKPA